MLVCAMTRHRFATKAGHVAVMAAVLLAQFWGVLSADKAVPASPDASFEFSEVDIDGNGCVEGQEEMQMFRLKVGSILGAALHLGDIEKALRSGRITHSADVNGDGRICECDLLSILLTESNGPGRHHHAFRVYEDGDVFDSVDTDRDGFLADDTEKAAMTEKLAKCVPVDKARMVVDAMGQLKENDGKVSREEYLLFLSPDIYPQAPAQPLPAQLSSVPQRPPVQPAPQFIQPVPQPILVQGQPYQPAVQPVPVQARSQVIETQANHVASQPATLNQPQPFKPQPQANPLNALNQPVLVGPPFRPMPWHPAVPDQPALRPFPAKYLLRHQPGLVPAVPAHLERPMWLQQAQPAAQPSDHSQPAQTKSQNQAREIENELHAHPDQSSSSDQSANLSQQPRDQAQQPRDQNQPLATGGQGRALAADEDEGKVPAALADLDRVVSSLKSVE